MDLFDLTVKISIDTSELSKKLNDAEQNTKSFSSRMASSLSKISFGFNNIVEAGKNVFNAVKSIYDNTIGIGVKYNQTIESYTTNFEVLLGSADAANQKIKQLSEMAAATPFELSGLADATQTLLAFQVPASETNEILKMLGDVSLGDSNKLSSLALVFGQVSSAGKLTGQDLLQFINVGFNPLNYIAERTGESMEELRDRMSKGAIGIDEVKQAFVDATSAGGQFYDGMNKASQTIDGLLSTLKDNVTAAFGKLATPLTNMFKAVLPDIIAQIDRISEAISRVMGLDVDSSSPKIFGDEEGMVKTTRKWLDETLAIWSDGKKEEDDLVNEYLSKFTENSAAIKSALEERKAALSGEGQDTSEIENNLKLLEKYDQQVSELLWGKQNKMLSEDDKAILEKIMAQKELLEQTIDGVSEEGKTKTEQQFDSIRNAIQKVGDKIVWVIENFDDFVETIKTVLSVLIGFKTAMLTSSGWVGLLASAISFVILNWDTIVAKWEELKNDETIGPWIQGIESAIQTLGDIAQAVYDGFIRISDGVKQAIEEVKEFLRWLGILKDESKRLGGGGAASDQGGGRNALSENDLKIAAASEGIQISPNSNIIDKDALLNSYKDSLDAAGNDALSFGDTLDDTGASAQNASGAFDSTVASANRLKNDFYSLGNAIGNLQSKINNWQPATPSYPESQSGVDISSSKGLNFSFDINGETFARASAKYNARAVTARGQRIAFGYGGKTR